MLIFIGSFLFISAELSYFSGSVFSMKPKLKVFEEFSQALLPHEARYLSSLAAFVDAEKEEIFSTLVHNALNAESAKTFNPDFDKRKYHHIKTWVEKKLSQRDVDKVGAWIMEFNKKLSLDLISASEEREMLDYIRNYKSIGFNFQQLYNVMKEYRSYLLMRLRYDDHIIVKDFLDRFASAFQKAVKIQEKLYEATSEITLQYTSKSNKTLYWEKWLRKVFENEEINGINRYRAFILLAFMYNTEKNPQKLQKIFDQIDHFFSQGQMYCRRVLYNYYSSRVLLHSQLNDTEKAIYYGKLAVRQTNEDALMYVNNLVAIYLKTGQIREASELLENYRPVYENTHNDLQKITYTSYYLRVLTELNQLKKAENIGIYFLNKFETEIFEYRWHHFFTSYLTVLMLQENYNEILLLERKYGLNALEAKTSFVPNLSWIIALSSYMESKIDKDMLFTSIADSLSVLKHSPANFSIISNNAEKLIIALPELRVLFKSYIVGK